MIRDEVKLVTLCGCSKVISVPGITPVVHVPCNIGRDLADDWSFSAEHTYHIRRFADTHEVDEQGYRVFKEVPEVPRSLDNLQGRYDSLKRSTRELTSMYRKLWDSVYGVDEGL